MFTTPPPRLDVLKDFAELAPLARTTVRLHPRRSADGAIGDSKLAGTFLWPADQPWPLHDECRVDRTTQHWLKDNPCNKGPIAPGTPVPFVPILQLRAHDFPEMPFPPEYDLFQFLWFPYPLQYCYGHDNTGVPFDYRVYWRKFAEFGRVLNSNPEPVERPNGYFPKPCTLHPERVVEYPNILELDARLEHKIERWEAARRIKFRGDDPLDFYNWECSVCPSTKIGGYPCWTQKRLTPVCACGREMAHLLTVSSSEWDGGTGLRWEPIEDRGRQAITHQGKLGFPPDIGHPRGVLLFVCTDCELFPTRAVEALN